MCRLKLRSRLPALDSAAALPLLLASVLGAALAFQLLVPTPLELPDAGPVRGGEMRPAAVPVVARADPGPLRALFVPQVPGPSATAAAAVPAATLVGAVRVGRSAFAVVQRPDGRIDRVGIGGRILGWRLRALGPSDALLVRNGERATVRFGGNVGSAAQPQTSGGEQ